MRVLGYVHLKYNIQTHLIYYGDFDEFDASSENRTLYTLGSLS